MGSLRTWIRRLAEAIEAAPERFLAKPHRVAIRVADETPWTIRMGDAQAPLEPRFDKTADLLLSFSSAGFDAWLGGRLDSIQPQDLIYFGNLHALEAVLDLWSLGDRATAHEGAHPTIGAHSCPA